MPTSSCALSAGGRPTSSRSACRAARRRFAPPASRPSPSPAAKRAERLQKRPPPAPPSGGPHLNRHTDAVLPAVRLRRESPAMGAACGTRCWTALAPSPPKFRSAHAAAVQEPRPCAGAGNDILGDPSTAMISFYTTLGRPEAALDAGGRPASGCACARRRSIGETPPRPSTCLFLAPPRV